MREELAFRYGTEAQIGVPDRLFNGVHHALVPDLHRERPGLRHRDARDLDQRHRLPIGMDRYGFEQGRAGPAGAKPGEFVLEGLDRALHAAFQFGDVESCAHG